MDLKKFRKRLRMLYTFWMKHRHDLWSDADVLVVSTLSPQSSSNALIAMSSAFYRWLFGYNFPNMVAVFSFSEVHFLCGRKRASSLHSLKDSVYAAVGLGLVIHVKEDAVLGQNKAVDEVVRMAMPGSDVLNSALKLRRKHVDDDNGDGGRKVVVGCMEEMMQDKVFHGNEKRRNDKGIDLEWKDVEGGYARLLRFKSEGEKVEEENNGLDVKGIEEVKTERASEEIGYRRC